MRSVSLCVLFIILSSVTLAQSEKLPDILKPDAASEAEAKRMGANVFKLVPRGMFPDPTMNSYKDEENPIGIRGGGGYFSFTTGLHSYGKTPQIGLDDHGRFGVGFYGICYGFFANLGQRDLSDIDSNSPEAKYFLSYRLPLYESEFSQEIKAVQGRRVDQLVLERYIPAKAGDTYLLRAISWEDADTLVAFRVLRIDDDGSATIAWKKLADFAKSVLLSMPDGELQQKVDAVIARENLSDIKVTVKDNWLYIQGPVASFNELNRALRTNGIRYRGETRESR